VIGVYSEINNITGFSPYLEIESFGLSWSLWTMVHYKGTIIPCMLLKCSLDISVSSYTEVVWVDTW
jgi:hypothetical protein